MKPRELHIELAAEALDYNACGSALIRKKTVSDKTVNIVESEYFVTNIIHLKSSLKKDYTFIDSFVIYICVDGRFNIYWDKGTETVVKGETILLPATITEATLEAIPEAKILEVFIKSNIKNKHNIS